MSNNYFAFRHFTVYHDLCAMKVGTDGVLLGAWAKGGRDVLDVGTGSGLIALCMAQRFPNAKIMAIDIDEGAAKQALYNVSQSPFKHRIEVHQQAIQSFSIGLYDSIVCNPPFFEKSLISPNRQRTLARHTSSLSARELFHHANRLLIEGGFLSVIIPSSSRSDYDTEAVMAGFSLSRVCNVATIESKPISRCMLSYLKGRSETPIEEQEVCLYKIDKQPSVWYKNLTADFYLNNL